MQTDSQQFEKLPSGLEVFAKATGKVVVRFTQWQALADFRTRSAHQQTHRPSTRIRYALLRNAVFALALATQIAWQPALGGTITGTVRAQGKAIPESSGSDDAYSSRKYKFAAKIDYSAMHDFVVYVDGLTLTNPSGTNVATVTTAKVAQSGAQFSPHILPVIAGTTVEWPNHDDIYHNVFSYSDAATFDLGLYKDNPPDKRVQFTTPGKVDVYCSIHQDMHCIVLVLNNPYFAATDRNGRYTIKDVPAGKYNLKAWGERLPAAAQEITVPETGVVNLDFILTP